MRSLDPDSQADSESERPCDLEAKDFQAAEPSSGTASGNCNTQLGAAQVAALCEIVAPLPDHWKHFRSYVYSVDGGLMNNRLASCFHSHVEPVKLDWAIGLLCPDCSP